MEKRNKLKLYSLPNNDFNSSNATIIINDIDSDRDSDDENIEYDVVYTSGEKEAEVRGSTEDEKEEEEHLNPAARIGEIIEEIMEEGAENDEEINTPASTNKRRREDLTFGEVPEFDHLEHTKPSLSEPVLHLPPSVNRQKPNSIFSLFFTDDILNGIACSTNEYAKIKIAELKAKKNPESSKNKEKPWKDTNVKELKIWIAFVIYQGIYKSPELSDYWNTDPRFPIHNVSQKMSLIQFEQIKRYLHISPDFGKPAYYYEKVNPLMNHVQTVSQKLFTPKSNVSLDEIIVQFKGRSKDTYRIKMKPIPQGYKIIALCDSGYTYAFYPTSIDKKHNISDVDGLSQTGKLVYYLTTKLDYKNYAYNIFMDNFFTSIELFKRFREMGIGACGTVKKPVVLTPENLQQSKKVQWNTRAGFVKNGVLALFWKDNGPVTMLTTIHRFLGKNWEVLKNRRRPRMRSTNGKQVSEHYDVDKYVKQFFIPSVINDYNAYMNGVDIADQLRSYYCTQKTSRRALMPLFFWLLDTSVINSYRIAKLQKSTLSQKNFRRELVWELIMDSIDDDSISLSNCITKVPRRLPNDYQPDKSRFLGSHIVQNAKFARPCHLCRWKKTGMPRS